MNSTGTTPSQPTCLPSIAIYPDLKGKVVLITGIGQVSHHNPNTTSSSSITTMTTTRWGNGAATALAFAQQGSYIFGCDISLSAAEETQRRIRAMLEGPDTSVVIDVVHADATQEDDVQRVVDHCVSKHGRIDVLVNNVGVSMPGGPVEMDPRTWDDQMAVNLKSVYLFCHYVLPVMEQQSDNKTYLGGGAVVNVSSVAGTRYVGKAQIAYSASKAGVIQFTRATGAMYARRNIRVNVVVPGLMHTPLVEVLADKYNDGDYEGLVEKRNASVPMGWMGEGVDVANAILWLCSAQSRYVTGQKIIVDGGLTGCTAPG